MIKSWSWGKFTLLLLTSASLFIIAQIVISRDIVPSYTPVHVIRGILTGALAYFFFLMIGVIVGWIVCRGWKAGISNRLKVWTIGVGIAFALSVINLQGQYYNYKNSIVNDSGKQNLNSMLIAVSEQENKNLPVMIDKETRLDNISASGSELIYNYKLVNLSLESIDKNINVFDDERKSFIINSLRANEQAVKLLKNGAIFRYNYLDKEGQLIATIGFNRNDCGL